MVTSYADLVAALRAGKLGVAPDDAQQEVVVGTGVDELADGRILVRWDAAEPLVHVIQPMVYEVPRERADAVARVIARINNDAKLPGLGYDEGGLVYYRLVLIRASGGIDPELVVRACRVATMTARDLLPALRAVATGASVDEAIAKLKP